MSTAFGKTAAARQKKIRKRYRIMHITDLFPERDLWQTLQASSKHIYLYGTGNGADKIIAVCRSEERV